MVTTQVFFIQVRINGEHPWWKFTHIGKPPMIQDIGDVHVYQLPVQPHVLWGMLIEYVE